MYIIRLLSKAIRFFGMACRSLRGGEVFVHVFFVFRLLCILPVCFVAFRPLIYLCSFIKKKKKEFIFIFFKMTLNLYKLLLTMIETTTFRFSKVTSKRKRHNTHLKSLQIISHLRLSPRSTVLIACISFIFAGPTKKYSWAKIALHKQGTWPRFYVYPMTQSFDVNAVHWDRSLAFDLPRDLLTVHFFLLQSLICLADQSPISRTFDDSVFTAKGSLINPSS